MAIQYRSTTVYRSTSTYAGGGGGGQTTYQFTAKAHIEIPITYEHPGYTYDDTRLIYDASVFGLNFRHWGITGQARIKKLHLAPLTSRATISTTSTRTISSKTRIRVAHTETLSSKTRIEAPWRVTSRARISRQQGWPIPEVGGPGYDLWQDTRLYSRANILFYIAFPTQLLRSKGRVTYSKTLALQSKARITLAQTLQMRANILPQFFTAHLTAAFSVQQTTQKTLRVVFYTRGASRNNLLTMKARIVQRYGSRVTGHFIVSMPTVIATVVSISDPLTTTVTQQTLSTRAKVVK